MCRGTQTRDVRVALLSTKIGPDVDEHYLIQTFNLIVAPRGSLMISELHRLRLRFLRGLSHRQNAFNTLQTAAVDSDSLSYCRKGSGLVTGHCSEPRPVLFRSLRSARRQAHAR